MCRWSFVALPFLGFQQNPSHLVSNLESIKGNKLVYPNLEDINQPLGENEGFLHMEGQGMEDQSKIPKAIFLYPLVGNPISCKSPDDR